MTQRQPFDLQSYIRNIQTRPCFVCEMVARNPVSTDELALLATQLREALNSSRMQDRAYDTEA